MSYLKNLLAFCLIIGPFLWGMSALHDRGMLARDAQAKTLDPAKRVGRAFEPGLIFPPKGRTLRLPPSSSLYQFDHDIFLTAGRASFHKECPYSLKDDPGEASCKMVWGAI